MMLGAGGFSMSKAIRDRFVVKLQRIYPRNFFNLLDICCPAKIMFQARNSIEKSERTDSVQRFKNETATLRQALTEGFYPDRIIGRHRHHRHPRGHAAAGAGQGQTKGATGFLPLQHEAMGTSHPDVCRDNNDKIPLDGSPNSGSYPGTGTDGTPDDPGAWFNVLPPLLSEKPLTTYNMQPGGNPLNKFPPWNFTPAAGYLAGSKIWECPAASMSAASAQTVIAAGGGLGFFSYA